MAQWEQQLNEREMHLFEYELKLLMTTMNHERLQNPTPKVQKRSGRFMRSFLHSNPSLSSPTSTYISPPTSTFVISIRIHRLFFIRFLLDFRHLISVCHNHPSNNNPSISPSPNPSPSTSSILSNSPSKHYHSHQQDSFSSNSTPTTPNLNRFRTLMCTYKRGNVQFSFLTNVYERYRS